MEKKFKDIVFHIDVNSAFLSWEAIRRLKSGESLDIRKIPSVIGGSDDFDIHLPQHRSGVVLAKSTPAKKFNIKTGEALWIAFKKCPNLFRASPDFKLYKKSSQELIQLILKYTPDIDQYSIDECFAYFDGFDLLYESPEELAVILQKDINETLGIEVNIGISTNRLLAKMASDFEKPNKIHTLYLHELEQKLWGLDVSNLFMCGKASVSTLNKLGIYKIGQLAKADKELLKIKLKSMANILVDYANGIESRPLVDREKERNRSIGNSTTLRKNICNYDEALPIFRELAKSVGKRLRSSNQYANQISVTIKNSNFISYSHQKKLEYSIDTDNEIYSLAKELFANAWKKDEIRLLGISVSDFSLNRKVQKEAPHQYSLLDYMNAGITDQNGKVANRNGKVEDLNSNVAGQNSNDVGENLNVAVRNSKDTGENSNDAGENFNIAVRNSKVTNANAKVAGLNWESVFKNLEATNRNSEILNKNVRASKLNHVIDELRKKYGDDIIK